MNLIKDVVEGMAIKLSKFGHKVYVDEVKSNLSTPCFNIIMIENESQRQISNRFKRTQPFQIVYTPSRDENCNFELYEVADKLMEDMEVIELLSGVKLRGFNISVDIRENVLRFYVSYNTYTRKVEDLPKVERLEERTDIIG